MSAGLLYPPRAADVEADRGGRPVRVAGVAVEAVREEWLVEDRWWSQRSIARRYFELALEDGRCEVVFSEAGRWFAQRA